MLDGPRPVSDKLGPEAGWAGLTGLASRRVAGWAGPEPSLRHVLAAGGAFSGQKSNFLVRQDFGRVGGGEKRRFSLEKRSPLFGAEANFEDVTLLDGSLLTGGSINILSMVHLGGMRRRDSPVREYD